jgi:hypothetical protein
MRSYSSLLVFEDIFNFVPTSNADVASLASMLFTPNVPVVMTDCGTTLGQFQTVNYELEGAIELATGQVISKDRIDQLLFTGTYSIATRTLNTCIAPGGVCQACYHASNQTKPVPAIGSRVTIQPEYIFNTDVIKASAGDTTWPLTQADNTYQFTYIYIDGVIQDPSTYTILNAVLTFNSALTTDENIVVHYTSYNRAPYLVYLAETYSGSMLGMKPLPSQMLPIRSLLIESLIPDSKLQLVVEYTEEVSKIPDDYRNYLGTINDPFEQALFAIAINCIFDPPPPDNTPT